MEAAINICLSLGIAIAVFALNLRIQATILRNPNPQSLGRKTRSLGYFCLSAGFLCIIIGVLILVLLLLPGWTWISVGITLVLLAFALIYEGKRLIQTDMDSFSREIAIASNILIILAVSIVIVFSALLLWIVSK